MNKDLRTRELAAIHASRRALALDEDTYRAMLKNLTGKSSSGDLNQPERRKVLDHMRQSGAPVTGKYPGRPRNIDKEPMLTKIEAQLADMGLPWAYADAIAQRQFNVQKVAWLRSAKQLSSVIAALDTEQKKRRLLESINHWLKAHNKTHADVEALIELPEGWTRKIKCLELVLSELTGDLESASRHTGNSTALNGV